MNAMMSRVTVVPRPLLRKCKRAKVYGVDRMLSLSSSSGLSKSRVNGQTTLVMDRWLNHNETY